MLFQTKVEAHSSSFLVKIRPDSYRPIRQERKVKSFRMGQRVCNWDCRVLHHPRHMHHICFLSHAHAPVSGPSVFGDEPCARRQEKERKEGMRESSAGRGYD